MPSAKPIYDTNGHLKHRQFDAAQWVAVIEHLQSELKPFYPNKEAVDCPVFGHPFDEWVNVLASEAWGAISGIYGRGIRLTNEQLLVEQKNTLKTLQKAAHLLSDMSLDLDKLLGIDADVLGTRDRILELMPYLESAGQKITAQPKAFQRNQVDQAAAVEMAIRVLRVYKDHGGRVAATADNDLQYFSDSIKILRIIGQAFGLDLSAATWKKVILVARAKANDLRK